MHALINSVQDVPVGPVEVDYHNHQHRGSIGDPIEEDSTSKQVFVKINIKQYIYIFPILSPLQSKAKYLNLL